MCFLIYNYQFNTQHSTLNTKHYSECEVLGEVLHEVLGEVLHEVLYEVLKYITYWYWENYHNLGEVLAEMIKSQVFSCKVGK